MMIAKHLLSNRVSCCIILMSLLLAIGHSQQFCCPCPPCYDKLILGPIDVYTYDCDLNYVCQSACYGTVTETVDYEVYEEYSSYPNPPAKGVPCSECHPVGIYHEFLEINHFMDCCPAAACEDEGTYHTPTPTPTPST